MKIDKVLQDFIANQTGIAPEQITLEIRLQDDLNIYGDDAFKLLAAFSKKFSVDLSEFVFKDYFSEEDSVGFMVQKIFKRKSDRKSFSVNKLQEPLSSKKLR